MDLTKNFAFVANLGEIPRKIALRFLALFICFSARILARFAVGFRPDFGRRDYCLLARILVRFGAGPRRDFGRQDFCFWVRILARFALGSQQDFCCWEFRFPVRILLGSWRDSCQEEKSWRDSHRDRGGIPPTSWSLFYKGRH